MTRLLFIDPVTPAPYEARTPYDRPLGESETAVLRVAEGLAQAGHRVTVAQCGRRWPARSPGGVAYVPFDYYGQWGHLPRADAVVVLGQHKVLGGVRKRFPEARLTLWLHDVPGSRRRRFGKAAAEADATVVCVSDAHRAEVRALLEAAGDWPRTARVHLPVDDALGPDATAPDPDALVAFAGAGMGEVLEAFGHVRAERPRARLLVLGEWASRPALPAGVVSLGPRPHREVVRQVRGAFAVFGPRVDDPDVSGLTLAEANAVGTPVLVHPSAAAREALAETPAEQRQLVDARDPRAAARRLARWWEEGRPEVACPPHVRTGRVVGEWERLLGAARVAPRAVRVVAPPVAVAA